MLVTGGTHAGEFFRLLGNGHEYGIDLLTTATRNRRAASPRRSGWPSVSSAREKVCVMLADNIFQRSLAPIVENFARQEKGARIVLSRVEEDEHLRHLGVAVMDGDRVTRSSRSRSHPRRSFAVTGVYFYDQQVWDMIPTLKPSGRGELEITDVNNWYVGAARWKQTSSTASGGTRASRSTRTTR